MSLLTVLTPFLYIFSFPKFNQSLLAWLALVPLSAYAFRSTPKRSFYTGWGAGTLAYTGLLYWIVVTFHAAHLSITLACLCLLLLSAYLGLYWGAWSALVSYVSHQTDQPSASFEQFERSTTRGHFELFERRTTVMFFGAAAWVSLEYLRTYLFSGFPWVLFGDSQVSHLPIIQIASITGVYGVSFLLVLVNLAIAQWRGKPVLIALVIVGLSLGFGRHHRVALASEPKGSEIHVALLQGNIDQYKKWDKSYVQEIQATYGRLVDEASLAKPDMIIWPETSVPGYLLQDPPLRGWLLDLIKKSGSSHLVGAPSMNGNLAYNAAFSIDSRGSLLGYYAKQHLVPFGETVPLAAVLGKFVSVLNELGGFAAGNGSAVVPIGGYPVGVNVCYEAIFPNLIRESVNQGAVLIANLTNDGWYMKTSAPYQHLAPNVFRAVENARWVMRADNTGVSALIAPTGEIVNASPIFKPWIIRGTVEPRNRKTLYTQVGDVFAWLCCLVTLFALLHAMYVET